jgi:hypothetical protein
VSRASTTGAEGARAAIAGAARHADRRRARALLASAMIAIVLGARGVPAARADDTPSPSLEEIGADGIRALDDTFWLGGDVTVVGGALESNPSFIELDDINLLMRYEPHPRLAFFSETRLENTLKITDGDGADSSPDIAIERLYADWLAGSGVTLRVGKFLTPFGLWNVTRRAPLTWTVERPLVTEETFPEHTTGVSVLYQTTINAWSLDAIAYGPAQDELPLRRSEEDGRLLAGGRIAIAHAVGPAFVAFGLNGAAGERETDRMRGMYGADLELSVAGHQVMAELASAQSPGGGERDLWGLYVQDALPLVRTLYGVIRFEHFTPAEGGASDGGLLGVWWRPWRHLIVKADYQFTTKEREDLQRGLLTSVALFF